MQVRRLAGKAQAIAEQMREVRTGVYLGGAVR